MIFEPAAMAVPIKIQISGVHLKHLILKSLEVRYRNLFFKMTSQFLITHHFGQVWLYGQVARGFFFFFYLRHLLSSLLDQPHCYTAFPDKKWATHYDEVLFKPDFQSGCTLQSLESCTSENRPHSRSIKSESWWVGLMH